MVLMLGVTYIDMFSMEICDQAVMEFLTTTAVRSSHGTERWRLSFSYVSFVFDCSFSLYFYLLKGRNVAEGHLFHVAGHPEGKFLTEV